MVEEDVRRGWACRAERVRRGGRRFAPEARVPEPCKRRRGVVRRPLRSFMNVLQKLRQIVGEVRARPGSAESWALAGRLLSRLPADPSAVARACESRDVEALDAIVGALEHPAPRAPTAVVPEETLKAALRAFNKRLKLSRLADESRLGNKYVTSGRKSEIDAIIPPTEFPPEVWRALAGRGLLKDAGNGFFAPVE